MSTAKHSLRSLGARWVLVVAGATSGATRPDELQRVFIRQLRVVSSTMGTLDELPGLAWLLSLTPPCQDRRVRLVVLAAGGCAGLVGVNFLQAFRDVAPWDLAARVVAARQHRGARCRVPLRGRRPPPGGIPTRLGSRATRNAGP